MPGPLPTFRSGEPVRKLLNARFLNEIVERLNNVPGRQSGRPRGGGGDSSTLVVNVLNDSGGDFAERDILKFTTVGLTVSTAQQMINFQDRPLFEVDVPDAADNAIGIALEPIADGRVGRAVISGVAVCTIDVTDAGHEFAAPTPADETKMTSGDSGPARILWKDSGTGDKTAVVLLGSGSGGGGGGGIAVDTVHVVGESGGLLTCRRVTLDDPAAWPPVETDPVVEYEDVYESENRNARIVDAPGTATHIIPLYRDRDGNHFVVFWKVDAYDDLELTTGFEIEEDPETCEITATPNLETYRWTLSVTPPGTPETGLTLTIAPAP